MDAPGKIEITLVFKVLNSAKFLSKIPKVSTNLKRSVVL